MTPMLKAPLYRMWQKYRNRTITLREEEIGENKSEEFFAGSMIVTLDFQGHLNLKN